MPNTNENTTSPAKKIIAGVVVFLIFSSLFALYYFINAGLSNSADVEQFKIAGIFDCKILTSNVVYDNENKTDTFQVKMSVTNIGQDEPITYDNENVNENTPTLDDLTEEQKARMSEEEMQAVNIKTIIEKTKHIANKKIFTDYVSVVALQNDKLLNESNIERDNGANSVKESLGYGVKSGETQEFTLVFNLNANNRDVSIRFVPIVQSDGDEQESEQIVNFKLDKNSFGCSSKNSSEINNSDAKNSPVKSDFIEFHGVVFNLLKGWEKVSEASVALKLENPNVSGASIEISYSSNMSADELAKTTAKWSNNENNISQIQINNINYYYYERPGNSFTLCRDIAPGESIRIAVNNVSFEEIKQMF